MGLRAKTEVKHKGQVYVTLSEFARRMGISKQAVDCAVKNGRLSPISIQCTAKNSKWIPFESSVVVMKSSLTDKRSRKNRESQKKAATTTTLKEVDVISKPKVRAEKKIKVTDVKIDKVGELVNEQGDKVSITALDDNAFSDCWIRNPSTNEPILNPENGTHIIDYDKAKVKIQSMIYMLQYQEKAGELVSKVEIDRALTDIFAPLTSSILQIPDRFAKRLQATVQNLLGISLDNVQKTSIKSVLVQESENICESFKSSVGKILEK